MHLSYVYIFLITYVLFPPYCIPITNMINIPILFLAILLTQTHGWYSVSLLCYSDFWTCTPNSLLYTSSIFTLLSFEFTRCVTHNKLLDLFHMINVQCQMRAKSKHSLIHCRSALNKIWSKILMNTSFFS